MCEAALRSWPGLTWASQRASQRPVTSGWRNSTCDLCCRPPAVACFLYFVHTRPLNSHNPDCPEAMSTDFSKCITIWTYPVCRNVGQHDKIYQERTEMCQPSKILPSCLYQRRYPFNFYLLVFLRSRTTLWQLWCAVNVLDSHDFGLKLIKSLDFGWLFSSTNIKMQNACI